LGTASSRDPILVQGAWLAGCLLVDVGTEHHPSTTLAAPALVPLLMDRLGGVGERMTSMTLQEEREFAAALWNALDAPPSAEIHPRQHHALWNNQAPGPTFAELPFYLSVPRPTLRSLVRLILSNDSDAVLAGVRVVHLLLRRELGHRCLQTIMQEEELPDALECVCDSSMEEAANVAADVLDDYFYDEQQQKDNGDPEDAAPSSTRTTTNGPSVSSRTTAFAFGIDPQTQVDAAPSWTTTTTTNSPSASKTTNAFAFGIDPQTKVVLGAGRGRGRSATMPAWMTK